MTKYDYQILKETCIYISKSQQLPKREQAITLSEVQASIQMLLAKYEGIVRDYEDKYEIHLAQRQMPARQKLTSMGLKITEKLVHANIISEEQTIEIKVNLNRRQEVLSLIKGLQVALHNMSYAIHVKDDNVNV